MAQLTKIQHNLLSFDRERDYDNMKLEKRFHQK